LSRTILIDVLLVIVVFADQFQLKYIAQGVAPGGRCSMCGRLERLSRMHSLATPNPAE